MSSTTPPGTLVLDRYVLGGRIGVGASGSVFRAQDSQGGPDVVVKFFDAEEDGYSPWASEMRLALRFKHPNIVCCLGTGFDESRRLWSLVFELAQGGSLRRTMASGRRLSTLQRARVLRDVAAALTYAHAQSVIHRDVKPENVLLGLPGENGPWLLTDFGAGLFLPAGEVAPSLAGSTDYMAPEVERGQAMAASDQYSLGIMGLELWCGQLPEPLERQLLLGLLRRRSGLGGIIGQLAATEPQERFATMAAALESLEQVVIDMNSGGNLVEALRQYLRSRRSMSALAVEQLLTEWGEHGPLISFLVSRKLLDSATARMLEAVQKGYMDRSLDSVLGLIEDAAPVVAAQTPVSAPIPVAAQTPLAAPIPVSAQTPVSAPIPVAVQTPLAAPIPVAVQAPLAAPIPVAVQTPLAAPVIVASPPEPVAVNQRSPSPTAAATAIRWPQGPQVGSRIGRYLLQEQLGQGATAKVFRSFHEMLNVPLAIKVFEPLDGLIDPDGAQRFRREAQTLFKLEHPHIVRVLDVDIDEGYPFILMEYVGETTLGTQIQTLGRLPAQRIAQIGLAVANALEAASQFGLLHRDVKPSNILERKDGHIKLVDFGISATRSAKGRLDDPKAALGLISGTPSYIAPEQAESPDRIDFRADMYSLGATLYHAAVGRPPFARATAYDTIMAHIQEEPVAISQLEPSFDLHLAWTIHRMLRKSPAERFPSWLELKDALGHTLMFPDQPEISTSAASDSDRDRGGIDTRTAEAPVVAGPAASPAPPPVATALALLPPVAELPDAPLQPVIDSADLWRAVPPSALTETAVVRSRPSAGELPATLQQRWLSLPPLQRVVATVSMALLSLLLLVLLLHKGGTP